VGIRALQSSTWSTDKILLWSMATLLLIDKFQVRLVPLASSSIRTAARLALTVMGAMARRLVTLTRGTTSALLAKILAAAASILSSAARIAHPSSPVIASNQRALDDQGDEAARAIANIGTQMLSPLVQTVMPVGNLDGTIDDTVPGVETFYWADEPGEAQSSASVHIAPGGFTTVRFAEQGPHPQDVENVVAQDRVEDIEEQKPYDSTEEFENWLTHLDDGGAVHPNDREQPAVRPSAERTSDRDHLRLMKAVAERYERMYGAQRTSDRDAFRLMKAVAERYEGMYCDRRDPTTSWEAAHKVSALISTWITETIDGSIVTHFDMGPHRSVRKLLNDPRQFHLVFMQTVDYYHDRVLPAILIIQKARLAHNWRKQRAHNLSLVAANESTSTAHESQASMDPPTRVKVEKMAVQPPRMKGGVLFFNESGVVF
jgi:hypothetical protein